ncbi:MAG: TlpA disulfide reductase family protein [Nitrospirota bacterium]
MCKILAALFVLVFLSTASALEVNQDAPLFSLRDKNNEFFHLSDEVGPNKKGNPKGIILNFFSSTCIPCKRELPILNSLADELAKKKIKIVIVGYQEDMEKVLEFLEPLKVGKPLILADPHGWVGRKYFVKGLPMTYLISSDGKIKDIIPGELPNIEKVIREKAGKMLK